MAYQKQGRFQFFLTHNSSPHSRPSAQPQDTLGNLKVSYMMNCPLVEIAGGTRGCRWFAALQRVRRVFGPNGILAL
jgi:hypothetical protein